VSRTCNGATLAEPPWMMKGLAVVAMLLGGCQLYFGDDDPPCYYGADKATPTEGAAYEVRDPSTGECRSFGGGYDCSDRCGPCAYRSLAPLPDWGMCYGSCDGLGEEACFVTPGCYAAYLVDAKQTETFWGCWDTAPSGPVQGSCENLDAYECSRHDDCIAVYETTGNATQFDRCAPEPSVDYCVSDGDCGGNAFCDTTVCYPSPTCTPCSTCGPCPDSNTCYGVCVPNQPHACEAIDCGPGYTCAEVCTTTNGKVTCSPACVPNQQDPGECSGPVQCLSPAPACPSGTTPGIKAGCYTGYCIPVTACSPKHPGQCNGLVLCDALPPACPTGTVPGVANACWSGYCIPETACPMAPCEQLTSETACLARADCVPIYDGYQCTCGPNGCTCQVLTFDHCETM
jgi:hypothetical protein